MWGLLYIVAMAICCGVIGKCAWDIRKEAKR